MSKIEILTKIVNADLAALNPPFIDDYGPHFKSWYQTRMLWSIRGPHRNKGLNKKDRDFIKRTSRELDYKNP